MTREKLQSATRPHGLRILGEFSVAENIREEIPKVHGKPPAHLFLIGNAGSEMWPAFRDSPEFTDGNPDPLNRWSARIGEELAAQFSARAVFPFGMPHRPFVRWGKRAGLQNSALGMLIHPEFGLWHAYRFALIFAHAPAQSAPKLTADICANCAEKPCLRACPVSAFTGREYDARACFNYLRESENSDCMRGGCLARRACPHGAYRYAPPHAAFHMRAFVAAPAAD